MPVFNKIALYLKLSWRWLVEILSADLSTPIGVDGEIQSRKVHLRYAPLATYVQAPVVEWSYAVHSVPTEPEQPKRLPGTRHAPGTSEQLRLIMVCKQCGTSIDDNALAQACPVCHSIEVTTGECTCIHFPSLEWIAKNRTRQTLPEMSARNPSCPMHGRKPRPAT